MSQGSHQIQTQAQQLTQTLSPQQILVVKLLELPTMELEERVRAEILDNPALEEGKDISEQDHSEEYSIDPNEDYSYDNEDIYLDEFKDEIDEWVINAIKSIGLDTAKAVLNAPREMLIEKADLEEDTVDEVLDILSAEFEEE